MVQSSPSSKDGGVPGAQCPAPSQVSSPLHGSLSEQEVEAGAGGCTTPEAGSQRSSVHGLWSSSGTSGVPGAHCPAPSQVSLPLQASPSRHEVPEGKGECRMPAMGSQESIVHALPSSTGGAAPAAQVPAPLQVSAPLQGLPSLHEDPSSVGV